MKTNNIKNPWENMTESSKRRVDSDTPHNLFWITDLQGNFGFCLQTKKIFGDTDHYASLKGISILKRNSKEGNGELFLILNNKEDWQIFHTLCEDLVAVTHRYDTDEKMISAVEVRLQRWQQLLKKNRSKEMSLEQQMGLFTELLTLKDIIVKKVGIKSGITSWVGPEFDKQDFLLNNAVIEVKSYRTTRGTTVHISSLHQLFSEKIPLFLLSFGLTPTEKGRTIEDIVLSIKKLLENEPNDYINIFDTKLMDYGYIPEIITEPLYKFFVDTKKVFFVSDEFPRILPDSIKNQITSVKYSIDLSKCSEYERDMGTFLK
ncbi:MAG: PD-(D/E)XK motif protein [Bacteroidetes bacterium]|nr:PD-(D/E)XK motif protein [Bacteroidota bacterium]